MIHALDCANYAGRLTPQTVACWAAQGITHAVIRLSLEDQARIALARQQIAACRDGGLDVSGYIWGYLRDDPGAAMGAALLTYRDLDLTMWALDIEESSAPKDARANADWVGGALATLDAAGVRYCLYTARWYWSAWLGDTTEFAHVPLWVADWDGVDDLGHWHRFGGWAEAVGKQHVGDTQLCGVGVDLNVFDSAWLTGTASPPEEVPAMRYDPDYPAQRQVQDWTCSVRTAQWMLGSIGIVVSAAEMQDRMVAANLVSPSVGLHDGSGAHLAAWLAQEFGLDTRAATGVSWDDVVGLAGEGPLGIGGHALYHWTPVRRVSESGDYLRLANPAPNWRNIGDELTHTEFNAWGPWAACWIVVPTAENGDTAMPDDTADRLSLLGALQHDIIPDVIRELADYERELAEGGAADEAHIARALAALRPHAVGAEE